MGRILFGMLLALLLSLVGCNQRPERDVPLDTSAEPLFLAGADVEQAVALGGVTRVHPEVRELPDVWVAHDI